MAHGSREIHKTQFPSKRHGALLNCMMNIILIIESICLSLDLNIKFLKVFLLDGLKTKILHPINYLDLSGIQQRNKIHFIAALLAHPIADVDFHSHKGVWITSDVLASALNIHYCIVCIDKILNVWKDSKYMSHHKCILLHKYLKNLLCVHVVTKITL